MVTALGGRRTALAACSLAALLLGGCGAGSGPAEPDREPTMGRTSQGRGHGGEEAASDEGAARERPRARVVLSPPDAPEVTVEVELARTPEERRRGLMYRRYLTPGTGMLFLFERPERHTFWMRNTFVALDIIFIDADRRIVGVVENATPLSDEDRSVEAASSYVLEVPAGFARRRGLVPGTPVRLEGLAPGAPLHPPPGGSAAPPGPDASQGGATPRPSKTEGRP